MQDIRSSIAQAGGSPYWLADARIIQDGALARVDIRIEDGRIAALAPWAPPRAASRSMAAKSGLGWWMAIPISTRAISGQE